MARAKVLKATLQEMLLTTGDTFDAKIEKVLRSLKNYIQNYGKDKMGNFACQRSIWRGSTWTLFLRPYIDRQKASLNHALHCIQRREAIVANSQHMSREAYMTSLAIPQYAEHYTEV